MKAEIDQSGKIEQLNTHTVVALSNKTQYAVYISSKEKIKIYKKLRKSVFRRKDQNAIVFATLVSILISYSDKTTGSVYIDVEYSGKNDLIESIVKKTSKSKIPNINFKLIGKSSRAHDFGISIYRRKDKSRCRVIDANMILKTLGVK